jgi:hypothetical protein
MPSVHTSVKVGLNLPIAARKRWARTADTPVTRHLLRARVLADKSAFRKALETDWMAELDAERH